MSPYKQNILPAIECFGFSVALSRFLRIVYQIRGAILLFRLRSLATSPLMKKITKVHLEYLSRTAPDLMQAVTDAKESGAYSVTVSLAAFRGDLGLIYAFLWYADTESVSVTFASRTK